jgi:hypothetical protein
MMEPRLTDEIIDEVHAIRQAHGASLDFDIQKIIADLRHTEQRHTEQGWPLVRSPMEPVTLLGNT